MQKNGKKLVELKIDALQTVLYRNGSGVLVTGSALSLRYVVIKLLATYFCKVRVMQHVTNFRVTDTRLTAEQVCDCILPFLIRAIYPSKLSTSTVSNIPITVLLIAGMSFADLNLLKLV